MTLTTTKIYVGYCDAAHPKREVMLAVDDGRRSNDSSGRMVRCAECGHIVKCDPDPSRLSEVVGDE